MPRRSTRERTLRGKVGRPPTTITACDLHEEIDSLTTVDLGSKSSPLDAQNDTPPTTRRSKRTLTHKHQPVRVTRSRKSKTTGRKSSRLSARKSTRISKLNVRRI